MLMVTLMMIINNDDDDNDDMIGYKRSVHRAVYVQYRVHVQ